MRVVSLKKSDGSEVAQVKLALSFFSRFMGLMGKQGLPLGQGMLFPKCNSIHTFFMRFPIDVIFADKKGNVVAIHPALKPWRMTWPKRQAFAAIELKADACQELGIDLGTQFTCAEVFS